MTWVLVTNKAAKRKEAVNLVTGMRVYINADKDPETVVVFPNGERVAYLESMETFTNERREANHDKEGRRVDGRE